MTGKRRLSYYAAVSVLLLSLMLGLYPRRVQAANYDYDKANAAQVYKYLTETMGYSVGGACGVMVNIYCESAFNPRAYNQWSCAFGLCQWLSTRYYALANYCAEKGLKYDSVAGQLQFMNYELSTYPEFKNDWKLSQKLKKIPNTRDGMAEAAMLWLRYYGLSGGDPSIFIQSRLDAYDLIWSAYGVKDSESSGNKKGKNLTDKVCSITLSQTQYVFDGKAKTPAVAVKYNKTTLTKNKDYTVSYSDNKNAGTATVKITGKGNYAGTVQKTYTIAKAEQTITVEKKSVTWTSAKVDLKITAKGKVTIVSGNKNIAAVSGKKLKLKKAGTVNITVKAAATANYKAASVKFRLTIAPSQAIISSKKNLKNGKVSIKVKSSSIPDGYQIQYTKETKFGTGSKILEAGGGKTKTVKLTGLALKQTWRFRVRGWKVIDGKRVYGAWSPAKKLKL